MDIKRIKDEWGELNPTNKTIVENYLEQIGNSQNSTFMLTIARDGEDPVRSVIFYDNALDAAKVYNSYIDWGFAKNFLTVTLYEPNGKIHQKVLKRQPGYEASFMRRNYLEIADILFQYKNKIEKETFEDLVKNISRVFSTDNLRFDEKRFLENCNNGLE